MSTWILIVTAAIAGLVAGIAVGWVWFSFIYLEKGFEIGVRRGFDVGMSACNVAYPKTEELRREYGMKR